MSSNLIYCYSGTGNCLDIAKNIAKTLGDTDIVMMRSEPQITMARKAERVGFVFPCYAGGLPGDVEKYVRNVTLSCDTYTFGVVCYAGYPGVGMSIIDDIVDLDYWAGISHQSACIWLMPHGMMMPPMSPKAAQKRSEKFAEKVANDVLNKTKLEKRPGKPLFNVVESKAWPVMAKSKAKKLTVSDSCIGCGQCEKLCPRRNIKLVNGKPQFGNNCIQCLSCLQYCPEQAIHMGGLTKNRARYHNPNVPAAELMEKVIHVN